MQCSHLSIQGSFRCESSLQLEHFLSHALMLSLIVRAAISCSYLAIPVILDIHLDRVRPGGRRDLPQSAAQPGVVRRLLGSGTFICEPHVIGI